MTTSVELVCHYQPTDGPPDAMWSVTCDQCGWVCTVFGSRGFAEDEAAEHRCGDRKLRPLTFEDVERIEAGGSPVLLGKPWYEDI